mmetsp:Transcript_36222/g.81562  ORF Transcript_36222/g.81562 Transcript_36222/m.81562 type:complete len:152 (+) Transcript_36222:50-505(+)
MSQVVKVCPRAKRQRVQGADEEARPVNLDLQTVEGLFRYKQAEAAKMLGISLSAMKSACRRIGISRWPYSRTRNDEGSQSRPGEDSRMSDSDSTLEEQVSASSRDRRAHGQLDRDSDEEQTDTGDVDFIPIERRWIEWFTRVKFDDDISFR